MPAGPEATPIEIACDESGFDGETLIGGSTGVFAHASVRLDVETAAAAMDDVRRRTQTVARELKAGTILRSHRRPILFWLIGPDGPLHPGAAHVHLTDKVLHLTGKMIELLSRRPTEGARPTALLLHRGGPQVLGEVAWERLLVAFNVMSRNSRRTSIWASIADFTQQLDRLRAAAVDTEVGSLLNDIRAGVPTTDHEVHLVTDRSRLINILDPMFPALRSTIAHWGRAGRPVSIIHDEQSSLTEGRIAQIRALSYEEHGDERDGTPGVLADFHRTDSRLDPRVQMADLLAGVARSIASATDDGREQAALTDLLRPIVDLHSVWPDERWHPLAEQVAQAGQSSVSAR